MIATFDPVASPLRTTHFRDPNGPATAFAVESFMDEMAASVGADPIEFRMKHLNDPRAKAVLTAAAEKAGWDRRPSPKKNAGAGELVTGRGVGLGVRNGTYVATIAEVEVNRGTGAVRVKRFVCAHDCGLIVNPDGLRGVISREPDALDEPRHERRSQVRPQPSDQRGLGHLSGRESLGCSRVRWTSC